MMGHESDFQNKLFITGFNLDKRIRKDLILRIISDKIDFNFIYQDVKDTYGLNGKVSVPPPVILKMMFLLFFYDVRSERELVNTVPERLDWLWFLGYDLDDDIPNHSVLSKARTRWGVAAFKKFFENILRQCVEEGLVDGSKLFVDASLIDADASNNSVVDTHSLKKYLNKSYCQLEERLESLKDQKNTPVNKRHISTTDPEASVTRQGSGKPKLRYKTHRGVDLKHEIITATKLTPGSIDDALEDVIKTHKQNTEAKLKDVVGDTKYGKKGNFLLCHDLGINAHMPSVEGSHKGSGRRKGIYKTEDFTYNPDTDTFICPAGYMLTKQKFNKKRKTFEYKASAKTCAKCELKNKCTRSKMGRTLKRSFRQDELDIMLKKAKSKEAKRDIKTRQHLSERSFARSKRYGYKRARWRGLWRMEIQDFLIAAVQNITVLINQPKHRMSKSNNQECPKDTHKRLRKSYYSIIRWIASFLKWETLSFQLI